MSTQAIVGIIMGSDSDLDIMQEAAEMLEEFKVPYEITIVSAHRTPERMFEYAKSAQTRGLKIIIAGAGGAAHLPGMTASLTSLPVIGVPVLTKNLSGVDSLYSIVQMPPGVPVATMAINGAKNAALMAVKILALEDSVLAKKISDFKTAQQSTVEEKAKRLQNLGFEKYQEDDF